MKRVLSRSNMFVLIAVLQLFLFSCMTSERGLETVSKMKSDKLIEEISLSKEDQLLRNTMNRYSREALSGETANFGFIYDEQFAGLWYDESGNLNVGVVNEARSASRNSEVIYHTRRFSYNFLYEIHHAITGILMPIYASIHSVGMTPQYNQVEVRLTDERYIPRVIEHLSRLSLYAEDAINFIVCDIAKPASTPIHAGGSTGLH